MLGALDADVTEEFSASTDSSSWAGPSSSTVGRDGLLADDAPTLLALPDEVLLRSLIAMSAPDLCAVGRTSKAAARVAGQGCLWLRHCDPRFWLESVGSDRLGADGWLALAPIGIASRVMNLRAAAPGRLPRGRPAELVDWKRVFMLERLWERVHRSCTPGVRASLRDGLTLASLQHGPTAAAWRALPPDVAASLLVHDGQQHANLWGLGLFFGGARLLSLDELSAHLQQQTSRDDASRADFSCRAADTAGADGALLPLTDTSGFQSLDRKSVV